MKKSLFKGKKTVSVFIASTMLALTLTATMNMQVSAAVNTSQSYKVYNASNGSFVQSYTLSENPVMDRSKGVVDTDDRVVDFSKNGVVKIVTRSGIGTGFVVDDHTIATAAHCICSKPSVNATNYNVNPISQILIFKPDGSVEKTITDAKQYHIPDNFALTSGYTNKYDYALITVSEDLSEYANFGLGVMMDSFKNTNKPVSATGFPGKVRGQTVNTATVHNMYTGVGYVVNNPFDAERQFCVDCDITPGSSGCPIYTSSTFDGKVRVALVLKHE